VAAERDVSLDSSAGVEGTLACHWSVHLLSYSSCCEFLSTYSYLLILVEPETDQYCHKVFISCIKLLENRCGHRSVHTCVSSFLLS